MINCPNCGTENSLISKDCSCCGAPLGFPNVNECSQKEEIEALESDEAVRLRATLLEDNSYSFVKRHKILAGGKIPIGYRAVWKDRQKLAVAKLAKKILLTNTPNYAKILLKSTGNRKKDEFIEVHIYGKINRESILSVRGPSKNNSEKEKVEKIKEYLRSMDKEWIEE